MFNSTYGGLSVEVKKKKYNPTYDFIEAISYSKEELFLRFEEREYKPFMINLTLACCADTILYAQEMNQRYFLPQVMQFDYLKHAIRKKKRYFPYTKKQAELINIDSIKRYFNISAVKAKDISRILTPEEIEKIETIIDNEDKAHGVKKS